MKSHCGGWRGCEECRPCPVGAGVEGLVPGQRGRRPMHDTNWDNRRTPNAAKRGCRFHSLLKPHVVRNPHDSSSPSIPGAHTPRTVSIPIIPGIPESTALTHPSTVVSPVNLLPYSWVHGCGPSGVGGYPGRRRATTGRSECWQSCPQPRCRAAGSLRRRWGGMRGVCPNNVGSRVQPRLLSNVITR